MLINERLKQLVNALGLNNNSFAKAIGVNPVVTFNVLEGRKSKPSFELLEKIIFTFDNINLYWLLKGEGEMFESPEQAPKGNTIPSKDSQEKNAESSRILYELLGEQLKEVNFVNRELLSIIKNMDASSNTEPTD